MRDIVEVDFGARNIGACVLLEKGVWIVDVFYLEMQLQNLLERARNLVVAARNARADIVHAATFGEQRLHVCLNHVFDIDEVALLVAIGKQPHLVVRERLNGHLQNHRSRLALVHLTVAIDIEIAQANNFHLRILRRKLHRDSVHRELGESIDILGNLALAHAIWRGCVAIHASA